MKKDSIGNRMKENYENRTRIKLTRRIPVILRLDGKAFHTLTKNCDKPFDNKFINAMKETALYLCKNIQGAKCAYVQSDEISILLTDFERLETDAWFDYNLQKIVSVSAAMASTFFTNEYLSTQLAFFDCRAFNIPKEDVCNYFIWRQIDWRRNSLQMLARNYFSHKELHKKNSDDIHEMLYNIGVNWANLSMVHKNGTFISPHTFDINTYSSIIFSKNRYCINKFLENEE